MGGVVNNLKLRKSERTGLVLSIPLGGIKTARALPHLIAIHGTEREDAEGREKFLKSGAGRRFLRAQLRHYLRVKGFASRGSDDDATTFHQLAT